MHRRSKSGEITAGIHETPGQRTRFAKRIQRAIDGKTLRDSAKVNSRMAIPKADHPPFAQLDRVRRARLRIDRRSRVELRQDSHGLKDRRDCDVKHTVRPVMKLHACRKHAEGPCVNLDRAIEGFAVETADVAFGIVKAHQPVNGRDRLERRINRTIDLCPIGPTRLDLHESPEQGSGAA